MIAARTRRTRSTSTCASAMPSAATRCVSRAPFPAIRSASAATSAASVASARTGRLSPWRNALRATAALPAAVRGPVLRAALTRLAARTAGWSCGVDVGGGNVFMRQFVCHRHVLQGWCLRGSPSSFVTHARLERNQK